MSNFNPEDFLAASTTESMETKMIPCPMGEYPAVIDKIAPRQWTSTDGTKSGISLDITWIIEDQGVRDFLGRDTVTVKQGLFLDISDEGQLETGVGKNIALGQLREACDLNNKGQAFSFNMLPGRLAKVVVIHRQDPKDADNIFAEIRKVAKS